MITAKMIMDLQWCSCHRTSSSWTNWCCRDLVVVGSNNTGVSKAMAVKLVRSLSTIVSLNMFCFLGEKFKQCNERTFQLFPSNNSTYFSCCHMEIEDQKLIQIFLLLTWNVICFNHKSYSHCKSLN